MLLDGIELYEEDRKNILNLAEKMFGGFKGKEILALGCGSATRIDNDLKENYPLIDEEIAEKGGIVYGLDQNLCARSKKHLEEFKRETGIIPVPGIIEDVDRYFKEKKFDGIFSAFVMGHPTRNMDWKPPLQKLYGLMKPGTYQCHYKFETGLFNVTKQEIADMGYEVLHFFNNNEKERAWEKILVLKRP